MIDIFKHAINKNAWLFLAAAWLYTLSFIFTNYFSYSSSATKVAKTISEYVKGQESSFKNIIRDSNTVAALINDAPSRTKEDLVTDAQGVFVYQVNDIGNPIEIYWNTSKMSIAPNDLYKFDDDYIVNYQNGTFEFIKKTIRKNNATYLFCSLIPIRWHYFLQNQYLSSGFALREEISNAYQITDADKGIAVKNSSGKVLFSIKEKHELETDTPGLFSILLRLTALGFFLVFLSNIASETVRKKNFLVGFSLLIILFFLLRIIIVLVPFPFNYHSLLLFKTSIYNGDFVNRTLGDLLFNSILLLWIVIFFRRFYRSGNLFAARKFRRIYIGLKYCVFLFIPLFTFANC